VLVLGAVGISPPAPGWRHFLGVIVVTLIGIGFFFAIVGVFGLPASIGSLLLFVALTLLIVSRQQAERIRP
jgi:hypothetical protein